MPNENYDVLGSSTAKEKNMRENFWKHFPTREGIPSTERLSNLGLHINQQSLSNKNVLDDTCSVAAHHEQNNDDIMYKDVMLNEYGFYTLKTLPTDAERKAYYKEQYYQNDASTYAKRYTEAEIELFAAKLEQKLLLIKEHINPIPTDFSFLDIGCGEGFAASFFKKKGFSVYKLF